MIDQGKRNVLGVKVDAVDYEAAVARVMSAAREHRGYACTALAVHGVMTGTLDAQQRYRLNAMDLVTPDGQPVRWALNALYRSELPDRVYGPTLTLRVCEAAEREHVSIYLFGSRSDVLERLKVALLHRFPGLVIAGSEPSSFRQLDSAEREALVDRIRSSGAAITLVGLGCPRQEVFAFECAEDLSMPVLAVGAAFDYHSGTLTEPAHWIQRLGLQWAHRLLRDPRRLWRRYLLLNPAFIAMLVAQRLGAWKPSEVGERPRDRVAYG